MKLVVEIITPQNEVFVPTVTGELGILPNHASLLTQVLPGELIIKTGGKSQSFAIMGGYLEVSNNQVNVLGDYAVRAESIEIAKAQAAKEKAEKLMKEKTGREDFATIEAGLRRSLLELKVARKHRPKIF